MALIPNDVLKKWQDGDTVDARSLNQIIEVIKTAVNDNFNRIKAANLPDYVDTYNKFLAISTVATGDTAKNRLTVVDGLKRPTMDYLLATHSVDYFISKNVDTLVQLNTVNFRKGSATYQDGKYKLTKSGVYNVSLSAAMEQMDNVGDEVFLKVFVYRADGSIAQAYEIDTRQYTGSGRWVRVSGGINLICTKGESIGMVMNHLASSSQWRAIKNARLTVVHIAESDFE